MVFLRISKCLIIILFLQLNQAESDVIRPYHIILNGAKAKIEDFPYFISLGDFCGGAILSKRWVVTAAHCVEHAKDFKLYVGGETLNNSKKVDFDTIIIHPGFRDVYDITINDIALVRLSKPLTFSDKVKPISISKNSRPRSSPAVFAGKGADETGEASEHLKKVDLVRLTTKECLQELPLFTRILIQPRVGLLEKAILCARRRNREPSVCFGDSGGPLVAENKLIGLASFLGRDCEESSLGFYVNVASYVPWIKKHTRITSF